MINNLLIHNFKDLTTTPENVEQLKKLVLQMAVQGKLTAKWREDNPDVEPANVLLEKIKEYKRQLFQEGKIKRQKHLAPISNSELTNVIPENWCHTRLGEISLVRGGKRVPSGHSFSETKTPHIYIRIRDMKKGSIQTSGNVYLKEETFNKIKNYVISQEDLYITIAGTIGQIGVVPERFDKMNLTENAAKISIFFIDKFYLKTVLESKLCQDQFFASTKGMAQPKLALKRIENSIIYLPPLKEQQAIVSKVTQLMSWCNELEKKIEKRDTYRAKMMQAVVKQAFKTEAKI